MKAYKRVLTKRSHWWTSAWKTGQRQQRDRFGMSTRTVPFMETGLSMKKSPSQTMLKSTGRSAASIPSYQYYAAQGYAQICPHVSSCQDTNISIYIHTSGQFSDFSEADMLLVACFRSTGGENPRKHQENLQTGRPAEIQTPELAYSARGVLTGVFASRGNSRRLQRQFGGVR